MGTFLAVTTVLLMIIISGRLIKTMAYAAAGEMSIQVVLMALLLRLPSFLQIIIPMSLFIAVLIGYGRMYAESEMTVLTATGFSNRRLLGYTMVPGVDRKSTRLNSSHVRISYAVFCLKKKK